MCFDIDSEPPIPRIAGAAVSHDDLVLTAADGNTFAAFLAAPDEPATTGVVIFPDVRGLFHFYEELALRFAERGHLAIAIDYFGRTAGVAKRDAEFEFMPHVEQTTQSGVKADAGAAVDELRARGATSIFSIGFCFGGSASWLAAASGFGLAGSIGFYGSPTRERGGPSVVQRAAEIDWSKFEGVKTLGVTAGASAPEVLVEEILDAFAARYTLDVETVSGADESGMFFPLPRQLRDNAAA